MNQEAQGDYYLPKLAQALALLFSMPISGSVLFQYHNQQQNSNDDGSNGKINPVTVCLPSPILNLFS